MKTTFKQTLPKLILLLILLNFFNKSFSQANCCQNDTIFFNNQVDCPICISVECYDPNNVLITQFILNNVVNDLPLMSNTSNCPSIDCSPFSIGYIGCGGPTSPQLGKILLPSNSCETCPNLKVSVTQVGHNGIYPPISVYSLNGPFTDVYNNCPCCSSGSTPNLEMSWDCNTKTITLKCIQ